ncbi:hypothetical protein [Hyalangium gracile]|uniref:hypothetical protein n=1 Tax=Hyalangium gracile TaxID=394092 RepID=UPI001CC96A1A|nr:hypothetical protein [Hyalangium gracile]
MRKPIPKDVPDEVKVVLAHLKHEPESFEEDRKLLLAELDSLAASAQGTLQPLVERMRVVIQSTRPGAAFEPHLAREFSAALESYLKDPTTPKLLPALIADCLMFLRDHIEATGMGPLLGAVEEVSLSLATPEARARQQEELQKRIKFGTTRA